MKHLIWLLVFASTIALAQDTQCVEVTKDHKIVFIPWIIPVDELKWTWHSAKAAPNDSSFIYVTCKDELVVSGDVCVPG